jgi:polyhydroxyalkanoate synthesis repressor PhaR
MTKKEPATKRRGRPPTIVVPSTGSRVVKKYGNRRLYDARDSRYINLEELMELFAEEDDLRVLDAVTGEDLTERTLRQALLSEEGGHFPIDLMKALLRHRRGAARVELERHLVRAVAAFEKR